MDFDGDDPLDDLLRDTSAEKFKSSITATQPIDLVSPNASAPLARKERKSALLAELFGTGSSTSGFALDDIRDQDASSNKPPTPSFSEGYSRSDTGLDKPSSALSLSNNAKVFGDPADERKLDSLNFSPVRPSHAEPAEKRDVDFSLGGYVPSVGKTPVGSSLFGSKSRPTSSPNSLTHNHNISPRPLNPANQTNEHDKVSVSMFFSKPELSSEPFQSSPKPYFQEERSNNLIPPTQKPNSEPRIQSTHVFHTPVPQPSNAVPFMDSAILSGMKESIEKFSDTFSSKFETLTDKTAVISEIACNLSELHKCLTPISQYMMTAIAQTDRSKVSTDVEKRLLSMESKLETLHQDNVNLRSRLETAESQLRDSRSELSRIKSDAEATVENNLKWIKESVNSLDNKVNSQSSQFHTGANETIQTVRNIESLYGKIQDRLDDVERRQSEKAAKGYCEEVQLLLHNELKWLRHEKDKLKKNRKDNKIEFQEVHGKINLLDQFAMVCDKGVRIKQLFIINFFLRSYLGQCGNISSI